MGVVLGLRMTGGLSFISVMVMVMVTVLIPLLGVASAPSTRNACMSGCMHDIEIQMFANCIMTV